MLLNKVKYISPAKNDVRLKLTNFSCTAVLNDI